jgi:hypothetical protein
LGNHPEVSNNRPRPTVQQAISGNEEQVITSVTFLGTRKMLQRQVTEKSRFQGSTQIAGS